MKSRSPLKLFYYKNEQNFGDAISATIVSHVSGRDVRWTPQFKCELYALGSLFPSIRNHQSVARETGEKPVVWGTGTMSPLDDLDFLNNLDVRLVRGPITAEILQRDDSSFGDTGLLIADAIREAAPNREDCVGLVPHMHFTDHPEFIKVAAENPRIKLIDVRDPDAQKVVRDIASCAHIISQSLHGLVTADAYGIPSTWLDPMTVHGGSHLKFHDYGGGIGRVMGDPIETAQIVKIVASAPTGVLGYSDGIAAAKDALYASFPDDLKQKEAA